jgi:hypothetical protein
MTNQVGRPRYTLADLPDGWRNMMHVIYADGGSDAEVKVALAIPPASALSNALWDELQGREPEFLQAIQEGRVLARCGGSAEGGKDCSPARGYGSVRSFGS